MANVDNPHGLRPLCRNVFGGATRLFRAHKLAAYGTALFINDAVFKAAAGTKAYGNCVDKAGTPGTTPYAGVNLNYGPASAATEHLIVPAAGEVFECQDNKDTDGVAAADLSMNANIELNAGSVNTQISGHELDESTIADTATLDVHILGLLQVPGNVFGGWARVEVTFNKASLGFGVAGA